MIAAGVPKLRLDFYFQKRNIIMESMKSIEGLPVTLFHLIIFKGKQLWLETISKETIFLFTAV